jgi:hypothetical protein
MGNGKCKVVNEADYDSFGVGGSKTHGLRSKLDLIRRVDGVKGGKGVDKVKKR